MLSRFISKPLHHNLRLISFLISSQPHPPPTPTHFTSHSPQTHLSPNPSSSSFTHFVKHFSTNNKNNNGDKTSWNFSSEIEDSSSFGGVLDTDEAGGDFSKPGGAVGRDWVIEKDEDDEGFDLFKEVEGSVREVPKPGTVNQDWLDDKGDDEGLDLFKQAEESAKEVGGHGEEEQENWATADGYQPWDLDSEDKGDDVFGLGETEMSGGVEGEVGGQETQKSIEDRLLLEKEEKELSVVLKGPDRAFGDLVATSGITEEMLESLIALKDLEGIQGLPPLSEIEDIRYEKNTRKSSRADIERLKQEEVANARVRQVDSKGRAYGTGKRKCSIARVWIEPGEGKFVVNDKQFDVYFPMLDQRAALLRPFTETKTLGLWDVNCTVKGGGISGQVGAIRLGISRALQNWEPDLRPPLKEAGFLTRDSRVVERKKPGKAKARKSFQWVKR
ncbi:hypothetical protein ACET3Z_029320 [Daucus carota]